MINMLAIQTNTFPTPENQLQQLPVSQPATINNLKVEQIKNATTLILEKIEDTYLKHFENEFKNFQLPTNNTNLKLELIKSSKFGCVKGTTHSVNDKTIYTIRFVMNLNDTDRQLYKKTFDKEIAFFNFNVTLYQSKSVEKPFKISYFSEVSIAEDFQSCKLFNYIFKPYTETVKELDIDVDYLHVSSKMNFTASLYTNKGYSFTPATLQIIDAEYEGKENYLKDSSVSYNAIDKIEMFRTFNSPASVETSIEDLEKSLEQK